MSNQKPPTSTQVVTEIRPLRFGESLIKIFNITDDDFDSNKYSQTPNKPKHFTNTKRVRRQMNNNKEPGKIIVTE